MKRVFAVLAILAITGTAYAGCPEGFTFNTAMNKCEVAPTCPAGLTLHPVLDICTVRPVDGKCPNGSSYNKNDESCEAPVVCPPTSAYVGDIGKCLQN